MVRVLRFLIGVLLLGVIATVSCSKESPATLMQPSPATPTPPVPTSPSYTISGVVYDNSPTARLPIAGVDLVVYSEEVALVTSDSLGRYTARVVGDVATIEPAGSPLETRFIAPCPSGTTAVGLNPNRPFDVDVVATALLSTSGLPDSYHRSAIYVSGTVSETGSGGSRPISGAIVTLGYETSLIGSATTLTDALGRYCVCTAPAGVGTDQLLPITVAKAGYVTASRSAIGASDYSGVNIELSRQ